ncbi:hypothetical protein [Blastococcus capsensis]|uniref:hypothetical protein n=1 Tax=Blastococcus capsensis TaxID=1564163 RepID=UPI00253FE8A2|nr:hypothetical protein [Blastococcus capsensis]MDK3255980.1 hypothetical protein [Blastococcus capsensis]
MTASVVGGLLSPAVAAATPAPPPAPSPGVGLTQRCGGTSWWAGTTTVCDGTVVYRDYVNDDHGADTGGIGYNGTQRAFGTLAHPAGDQRYAEDRISVADLVRLELSRHGNRINVAAETAALYRPDDTVLALAIDTDGDPMTGGGTWGELDVRSDGWDRLVVLDRGDPDSNTLRGSFPLPTAPRWRVQAVTADAAAGTVMNVAFRGPDEEAQYTLAYAAPSEHPPSGQGAWFEDRQAAALTSGDVSAFGYTVSTEDLRRGVTREPGMHERVYTSDYTVPAVSGPPTESMSYTGVPGRGSGGSTSAFAQVFNLLGRYQPYGVYVPASVTSGSYGLQMEWHGSNQGMVAQINQPGMQQRFGEELGRLLVTPEARGPNGYGSDVSERDLLDVMADVQQALPVDPDRVFSSGYSQGGYITFRMAMLFPDRFAGFTGWVPFTGNDTNGTPVEGTVDVTAGAVGNMIDFAGNARHVPGSMLFGAADELVQAPSAEAMRAAFADAGGSYRWWQHTAADHFTFILHDDWRKEAAYSASQRLVHDPARVTFRTATFLDAPEYGIRHDAAYWVSGIRPRTEQYADTDLTSSGCGIPVVTATPIPGAGPDPVPYVQDGRDVTVTRGPAAARLEGTLANVAELQVDTQRTCLTGAFTYELTSDGPATLTLSDGRVLRLTAGVNRGSLPAPR